jgi:hypothetical protein
VACAQITTAGSQLQPWHIAKVTWDSRRTWSVWGPGCVGKSAPIDIVSERPRLSGIYPDIKNRIFRLNLFEAGGFENDTRGGTARH